MSRMLEYPAVLTRELLARVIDVSASGCMIETRRRLEVGTIGRLRVKLCGEECEDDVEVTRCDAVEGPVTSYHVGVRLLWTTPRRPGSIRHAVASQLEDLDIAEATRVM
jgi:PilZ domain